MIKFNPKKVGTVEYSWWKAHHEGDKKVLAENLLKQNILLYSLNKKEATQALSYLVEAVKAHDIRNWNKAVEAMGKYFQIIKVKTKLEFDTQEVAKLEIGWWKLHDLLEHSPDKSRLAKRFSSLYSKIFNIPSKNLLEAGKLRAQATHEHDLAEDPQTPKKAVGKHWKNTKSLLVQFYSELLKAINS